MSQVGGIEENPSESQSAVGGQEVVRRSTLVVTNAIKLAGLVLVIREMITTRDPVAMFVCVVMMSGVQGLEDAVVIFFQKFFGVNQ